MSRVEVCSKEEGFEGSFYGARVLRQVGPKSYEVEYSNLFTEDESSHLIETVSGSELRPRPPGPPLWTRFCVGDTVDALHNDGWWVGRLTARRGVDYFVYFETTSEMIAYPVYRLRTHRDWVSGMWVSSKRKAELESLNSKLGSKKKRSF
ncbi:protein AGENET DOMAIN (AGD)-CONTAINING P1-like isoform X2 [Tripterygium wilfordii]|uniref:protein AGENET DOMAIN (AGD)-CONTAINING P1-like isoform X2 n=1 Tax=Tripterygium wilfordii TaxID=458696 RepID=UPI0018F7EB03|nr:protein AGENET DOMAIN (AGD)-CONTAINING P1-like isoform X2 [Tripterygium wilfordii]